VPVEAKFIIGVRLFVCENIEKLKRVTRRKLFQDKTI
jgi:hypothetical protein